jgi:hypothetical protein
MQGIFDPVIPGLFLANPVVRFSPRRRARPIILRVIFPMIGGTLSVRVSYWAAEQFITSLHEGDTLQKKGGLSPAQAIGK